MSDFIIFDLTIPQDTFWGGIESIEQISIDSYQSGIFLLSFSGSTILDFFPHTLGTLGTSASYVSNNLVFPLTINNNSFLSTGIDVSFQATVYNYFTEKIISYYNGSTVANISTISLKEFVFKP